MSEDGRSPDLVVARRPVIDAARRLVAFELVYRPSVTGVERYASAESAPVALHDLLRSHDLVLDDVVGDCDVVCEVELDVLAGDAPLMLKPQRTVLRLSPAAARTPAPDLAEACRRRRAEGYRVLLPVGPDTSVLPEELRDAVDLVAVEVASRDEEAVRSQVSALRAQGVGVVLCGCDTAETLRAGLRAGVTWLQGSAVGMPPPSAAARAAPSSLAQVRLGAELLRGDLEPERIESILRSEPALVAQVLDLAAAGRLRGVRGQVRSVREALVVMGSRRVQRWAAVTILARHGRPDTDALLTGLVRARTCELLAPQWGVDRDLAFTAGLLSALGLLLGVDESALWERLSLDEDLVDAAARREGALGQGISRTEAYQAALGTGPGPGDGFDDGFDDLAPAGAAAFGWATGLLADLGGVARP